MIRSFEVERNWSIGDILSRKKFLEAFSKNPNRLDEHANKILDEFVERFGFKFYKGIVTISLNGSVRGTTIYEIEKLAILWVLTALNANWDTEDVINVDGYQTLTLEGANIGDLADKLQSQYSLLSQEVNGDNIHYFSS